MTKVKLAIAIVLLVGCAPSHKIYSVADNVPGTEFAKPETFESVRSNLFEPHCARCHVDLWSVDVVRENVEAILTAVEKDKMPPKKPLSVDLKNQLREWYSNGMP